jgi:hypothetical protein
MAMSSVRLATGKFMSNSQTDFGQGRSAKPKHDRFHHRWKGWVILTGCFCIVAVFTLLAMTTDFTTLLFSRASSEKEMRSANSEATRNGTIVVQTGENRCEFRKFDNGSGRIIVENTKSCNDPVILDSYGVPVPMGTVHRLNAISKSFGNAH